LVVTGVVAAVLVLYAVVQAGMGSFRSEASHAAETQHTTTTETHGEESPRNAPDLYAVAPFVCLLLCIALMPLFHATAHFWEVNRNKLLVSAGLALVTLLYYAFLFPHGVHDHGTEAMSEPGWPTVVTVFKNAIFADYIPFIILLFSLFVVSGGIAVHGHLVGRPWLNATILGIGAVLASIIGTTGAAMVLVRPLLKANSRREFVAHTMVFFIFVVCNTGGCLLPIGDPPLFLGYLRGVRFFWTLNLWPQWLFMNLGVLIVYLVWDTLVYRRENHAHVEARPEEHEFFGVRGALNFVWLAGVIAAAALLSPGEKLVGTEWVVPAYFREMVMLALSVISLWSVGLETRARNSFNYDAIEEVAMLFVGIFICMQAPLQILDVYGAQLGIDAPWKFYWCSGTLSSFLDNAPTYAVFFEIGKRIPLPEGALREAGVGVVELAAISLGSVFMGAMTYIGNGPNFMVKTIAEKANVKMPSFFGYMVYSFAVLLPLSIAMTLIFFR
jgi:Na+/H+ antiporter NhaD/arsenite permease-like protein